MHLSAQNPPLQIWLLQSSAFAQSRQPLLSLSPQVTTLLPSHYLAPTVVQSLVHPRAQKPLSHTWPSGHGIALPHSRQPSLL